MKCPYCNQEMKNGALIGNNYKIKFMPNDKNLLLGIWAHDSVALGKKALLGRATVSNTWYCAKCSKYVIDVPKCSS